MLGYFCHWCAGKFQSPRHNNDQPCFWYGPQSHHHGSIPIPPIQTSYQLGADKAQSQGKKTTNLLPPWPTQPTPKETSCRDFTMCCRSQRRPWKKALSTKTLALSDSATPEADEVLLEMSPTKRSNPQICCWGASCFSICPAAPWAQSCLSPGLSTGLCI